MKKILLLFLLFLTFLTAQAQSNCPGITVSIDRNVSTSGGSDGRISIRCVTNCGCTQTQGLLFSVNNGNFVPATFFEGLRAGEYTVRVLDRCSGCIASATPVRITQPEPCVIVVATASRNVSTLNGSDGQITATCNGACFSCAAGYEYSLNGGTFQRTPLFNNLRAGLYQVTIRDRCSGCTNQSAAITVIQPAGTPNCASVSIFNERTIVNKGSAEGILVANCSGCDNCATGFEYALNDNPFQSSNRFTNLRAGTYTITVKNLCNNCTSTSNAFTLTEPEGCTQVTARITQNIITAGGNQGTITASCVGLCNCPSGYQYAINDGPFRASPVFGGLTAGRYVISIRDNCAGCVTASNPIILNNPGVNTCSAVSASVVRNVSNFAGNDGEINAVCITNCNDCPSGFQYQLNNGLFQNSGRFTGLRAGVYTVTQRNTCTGCTSQSNQVVITEPGQCVGVRAVVLNDVSVVDGSNGRINAVCTGRCTGCNLGYEYSLNGGRWQLSSVFPNLRTGLYFLRIRDLCTGCISEAAPAFINSPANSGCGVPTLSVFRNVSRNGGSDGSLTVNCTNNCFCTLGYEYSLNNQPYQSGTLFPNLKAGTYTVVQRSRCNGCISVSGTVTLTEPPFIPCVGVTATVTANSSRPGAADGVITATCAGGGCNSCSLGYSYALNGGAFGASNVFTGLLPGTYTVSIRDNCSSCVSLSAPVTVTAPTPNFCVNVLVSNVLNVTAPGGFDGGIVAVCNGSNCGNCPQGYEYSIDNGTNYQASNNFGGLRAGLYLVKIREKCSGCASEAVSVTITEPVVAPCPVISASVTKRASSPTANDGVIQAVCAGNCSCRSGVIFTLNGVTQRNVGVFTGLAPGTYVITMTENCRPLTCISTDTLEVTVDEDQPCRKAPGIIRIQVTSGSTATVTWSTVPGVLWHVLEYKSDEDNDWTVIRQLYGQTYTLRNLSSATNYSVRVRAHCIEEYISDYSPEASFITKRNTNPVCAAPSFRLTQIGDNGVRLDWAPVLNATCYIVSYRQTGDDEWTEFLLPNSSRNYFFTDLPMNGAFQFRMKTNCTGCDLESASENPYSFVLSYALRNGLSENISVSEVYPNPAGNFVTVRTGTEGGSRLTLTDLTGRTLLTAEAENEHTLDLTNIPAGVYSLQAVRDGKEILREKLVIVK